MPRRHQARTPLAPASVSIPVSSPRRRWLYAVLAGLALAASVALPAIPATADSGTITFDAVSGDGSGNLTVTVTSDVSLASVTVHLWSGGADTGTDVLDLSDFTAQGTFSPGQQQTWTLNSPSTDLATLAPGTYMATADATDVDGDETVMDEPLSGTFSFLAQPVVTLTQLPLTTTEPNQSVNITGQLTCSTISCYSGSSWPSLPVTVSDSLTDTTWPTPPATADTAPDGSFSVEISATPSDTYTASVGATATTLAASSAPAEDVPTFATTSISAAAASAPYGQQTIAGTLTYQSGLTQIGAPSGVTITATASGRQPITTTTGPAGSFSMTLPPITGTTIWHLGSAATTATTPFLAGTTTSISATQTWPATLSKFTATLSKYYDITVSGCLSSALTPAPPPDYPTVQIQYELTTAGPWVELGTVSTTRLTGCPGAAFLARGGAPAASAYYRAYFPGDQTYEAATAAKVKAALIATRFSPFAVSAHTVATTSSKVTVSGTLEYQKGSRWPGYADQSVLLIYSKNDKTWYAYKWLKANSKGAFSKTFADSVGTAYWSANYDGNATHLVAGAPVLKVTVKHALRKLAAGTLAQPGQLVTALGPRLGDRMWQSTRWPFVLLPDPLLILMGIQA